MPESDFAWGYSGFDSLEAAARFHARTGDLARPSIGIRPGRDRWMKQHAPGTLRNRRPIADVLRELLPAGGTVLEIASGTGEHAAFFAALFPDLVWQPSDVDPEALDSIAAWRGQVETGTMLPPILVDAEADIWPIARADAILCINMVHISPWAATIGLLRGAARLLPPGGPLILYGPFRRADAPTAPGNGAFDRSLKGRNPEWGLRDLDAVSAAARSHGLRFDGLFEMAGDVLILAYRRD